MSKRKHQQETSSKREKARFLGLSSQLINEALNEALEEIDVLSNTLFEIASTTKKLGPDDSKQKSLAAPEISSTIQNLSQKALGQLQFADRMQQRLNNVGKILDALANHPSCIGDYESEEIWNDFLSDARNEFTMESEKILFDEIFENVKINIKDEGDNISNTHLF